MSLSPGTYRARAREAALGFTSNNKEQVVVLFDVLDEGFENESISWYGYFSEAAEARTLESLRNCGCTFPNQVAADLSGINTNEVQLVVAHEEYEGKIQIKVKWVNRLGGMAMKAPMTEADKAKFSARMKGRLAALGAKSDAAPAPKPAAAKAKGKPAEREPGADDELDELGF